MSSGRPEPHTEHEPVSILGAALSGPAPVEVKLGAVIGLVVMVWPTVARDTQLAGVLQGAALFTSIVATLLSAAFVMAGRRRAAGALGRVALGGVTTFGVLLVLTAALVLLRWMPGVTAEWLADLPSDLGIGD